MGYYEQIFIKQKEILMWKKVELSLIAKLHKIAFDRLYDCVKITLSNYKYAVF